MSDLYPIFKTAHVLGAVVFLGNIVVSGWWKAAADRTRDAAVVAFAQRQVTATDLVFTGGGLAVMILSGTATAVSLDLDVWRTPWLLWGVGLLLASGAIWAAVLIPCQIAQAGLARGFAAGGPIPPRYWALGRIWGLFGVLATLLPLAAVWFMVAKPL